jgi:hypothetical protein
MKTPWILLIFLVIGFTPAASANELCGPAPAAQFLSKDDETLKGQLQGEAKLLSRFIGNAALGGEVDIVRNRIYAEYPDADKARTDAYLLYLFCQVLMDEESDLSTSQKLQELRTFKRELKPDSSSNSGNSAWKYVEEARKQYSPRKPVGSTTPRPIVKLMNLNSPEDMTDEQACTKKSRTCCFPAFSSFYAYSFEWESCPKTKAYMFVCAEKGGLPLKGRLDQTECIDFLRTNYPHLN